MTIPWMMNCAHSPDGWCLECVVEMGNKLDLREKQLIECQHQLITRNAELFEARAPRPEERAPASENYRLALAFQIRHKGLEVLNSLDNPYQAWEAIIAALEAHSSPQKE